MTGFGGSMYGFGFEVVNEDPKFRPREPSSLEGGVWKEARRRSDWSWSSRSSIPRSWEKSGGLTVLACCWVMLRAEAKGSAPSEIRLLRLAWMVSLNLS
jgi:hypothetical protein